MIISFAGKITDHLLFRGRTARSANDMATTAAGLWTTATDLVKFGTGWSSLLPDGLADEALRPQAAAATADPGRVASAGASTRLAAMPLRPATPRRIRVPDRQAPRQSRVRRADEPEGAGHSPHHQGPPAKLLVPVHLFLVSAARAAAGTRNGQYAEPARRALLTVHSSRTPRSSPDARRRGGRRILRASRELELRTTAKAPPGVSASRAINPSDSGRWPREMGHCGISSGLPGR
jgi:hypothetical protein